MTGVGIVTESVSCLTPADIEDLPLSLVPIPYALDGAEYLDGIDLSAGEFYSVVQQSKSPPATSAPSPAAYLRAFEEVGTDDVLCLTVSTRVSTAGERCAAAISYVHERYPDRRIILFNTGVAAMAQGLLALRAAERAKMGLTTEEIIDEITTLRERAHLLIFLDTLKYLARTGRLRSIASLASGLLHVKPVVHVNNDQFDVVQIARSRRQALTVMLKRLRSAVEACNTRTVILHHAGAPAAAGALFQEVQQLYPHISLRIVPFSPVMGAYAGPGLLGFAWIDGE
ncbi:MAG: DegV family protein [Chloroflexi bacterium]|nr:DegV family protein [Chloroflexota bacterium]